jgi:hypothetical protein
VAAGKDEGGRDMSEARINKEYLLRMSGVALFMAAVCVWSGKKRKKGDRQYLLDKRSGLVYKGVVF